MALDRGKGVFLPSEETTAPTGHAYNRANIAWTLYPIDLKAAPGK
jgi:hypothetical protein